MSRQQVSIPTADGEARAFVFTPDQGQGPWPAVLFYMDAPAIRPALFDMGERLAGHGYYVLMPDVFWRRGPYEPIVPREVFGDPDKRQAFMGEIRGLMNPEQIMDDTAAYIAWLERQPKARQGKIGVTGYCMGGGLALRAAGLFPDKIAAVGCFHGANLATDAADSPHLLAPKMKAKILVAGGDQDSGFDDAQCARLDQALKDAGLDAEVTIYRGAHHGYAPADMPAHNPEAAERHWREMLELFEETLKQPEPA
jgi:carboxymethylenebutenolidase